MVKLIFVFTPTPMTDHREPSGDPPDCVRRLCSLRNSVENNWPVDWPCGASRVGTHFFNTTGMPGVSLTAAGQNFCQPIKSPCRGLYPPGPSSSASFCHSWDPVASAHTRCCCTST